MASEFTRGRPLHRLVVLALMVGAGVFHSAPALADPTPAERETARGLMNQGDRRFDAKDYEKALMAYEGANAIMGVPTTGMGVARAQAALGHLVEARDAAVLVTRMPVKGSEPRPFVRAREAADKLARELGSLIPSIQVAVSGPTATAEVRVTLDDQVIAPSLLKLPLKTDPGRHVLRASSAGFEDAAADVTLQEGENASVTLGLKASAAVPVASAEAIAPVKETASVLGAPAGAAVARRPYWPLVYGGFGVGAAGLITGAVAGVTHLNKVSTIKQEYCGGGTTCQPGYQAQLDSARPLATVSTVGFIVGAAGVGAGVVGLLLSGPAAEHAAEGRHPWIAPEVGVGSIGVSGGF
jgi:hypothetical protein